MKVVRPKTPEELAFLTVSELGVLIQTRQVSSEELTELALDRLKRFDKELLCVVSLTEERALKQARTADVETKGGQSRGPLHGIPWGAKDLRAVPGYPTTWGSPLQGPGTAGDRDGRRATRHGGRGAGGQAHAGRVRPGRRLVRRNDQESLEDGPGLERLVGGARVGDDDQMVQQTRNAWPNSFRTSRFIPAVEYIQANRIRTLLMQKMAELMRTVDAFVTPSFGGNVLLTTNLTGHPALVLPNGFNPDGTPVSLTFIGKLFGEAELLAVAEAYQSATDFHRRHPEKFG